MFKLFAVHHFKAPVGGQKEMVQSLAKMCEESSSYDEQFNLDSFLKSLS